MRVDNKQGKGVMTFANQELYDGQWKNSNKDGRSEMTFHYGHVYEGEFRNDKMHGKGTYTQQETYSNLSETGRRGRSLAFLKKSLVLEMFTTVTMESNLTYTDDAPPSKRRNVCVSPS